MSDPITTPDEEIETTATEGHDEGDQPIAEHEHDEEAEDDAADEEDEAEQEEEA